MEVITDTSFMELPLFKKGKVRDLYEVGDLLLVISTDRISAFDVIMDEGIPGKGVVLNQLAAFWFEKTADIVRNHVVSTDMSELPSGISKFREQLEGRSMLVRKADPLPVECVVRGYLSGGGWSEYGELGSVSGVELPTGLLQAARLPEPIFTPATKAEPGEHDENISIDAVKKQIGEGVTGEVERISLDLYARGVEIAESRGIILADTKFEFGYYAGELLLIDEILTPDSSRFWPKDRYELGHDQVNLDKQFLRDWLETLDWSKRPPPPTLPPEIIEQTAQRYRYIQEVLLGE
ncbi:MAG: phosphoribosylaminoimidazolesuccinocarboxamide synthase [Actinobacteria bacterium]|nr:phosphoribosylaminoimidazolesuccinocarboxamide synthase [Actinomycetota bacterium]MCG2796842.1 phosphoribosylaminoimidazolesuccinocarboxamide synthase [Actinomycetes bacterium]